MPVSDPEDRRSGVSARDSAAAIKKKKNVMRRPELLKNTSAVFFIDNMVVKCNIVNGASKQLDAGSLTFALHLRLASLNTACWWEWIASESNCSDGGSRVGVGTVECPMAKSLGIILEHIEFPRLPRNFMWMRPCEWAEFWESNIR